MSLRNRRQSRYDQIGRMIETAKATDITTVIERLGLPRPDTGQKTKIRKEDKTPSTHIYRKTNSWYDFGLGKGGDTIALVQEVLGYDFDRAVKFICAGSMATVDMDVEPEPEPELDSDTWGRITRISKPLDQYANRKPDWCALIGANWGLIDPQRTFQAAQVRIHLDPLFGTGNNTITMYVPHTAGQQEGPHAAKVRKVTLTDYQVACLDNGFPGQKVTGWDQRSVQGSRYTELYRMPSVLYGWPRPPAITGGITFITEGESDAWALWDRLRHPIGPDRLFKKFPSVPWVVGMPTGAGTWKDSWRSTLATEASPGQIVILTDPDDAGASAQERIIGSFLNSHLAPYVDLYVPEERFRVADEPDRLRKFLLDVAKLIDTDDPFERAVGSAKVVS